MVELSSTRRVFQMDKKNKQNVDEKLKKELDDQKKYSKDIKELLQKVQAEFENYRKRMEKDKQEFVKFASADVVSKLLPVVDSLELALQSKENQKEFAKGVELIYQELMKVLGDEGLKRIEAKDKVFDPRLHEALLQEAQEQSSGHRSEASCESDKKILVLQELQPGYMFNDKVLRHTKVKISKVKEIKNDFLTSKSKISR